MRIITSRLIRCARTGKEKSKQKSFGKTVFGKTLGIGTIVK